MLEIKLFRTNISILHSLKLFLLKIMRKLYHSLFFSEKAEKPVPSCVQSVFRTLLASYSYTVLTQLYLTSIFAKSHIYLSVIRILNLVLTNNAFQLFWLQVQIQGIQTRVTYTSKSPQIIRVFLIGIHSLQGRTATTRHGVTTKRNKKIKACRKSLYKEPTVNMCLLILDLKPFKL